MPARPVMSLTVKVYAGDLYASEYDTLADALNDADLKTHIYGLVNDVLAERLPPITLAPTLENTPEWFTVEVTEV